MNTAAARPGDRPPLSLPRKAVPVIPGLFVFWGLTPAVAALAVPLLTGSNADPFEHFFLLLAAVSGPVLLAVFGLRWGKLWGIRLVRSLWALGVAIVGAAALVGLLAALSVLGRGHRDAVGDGEFLLIVAAVAAPFGWWMGRTIARVRWLDPRSTPAEWEAPLARPRPR